MTEFGPNSSTKEIEVVVATELSKVITKKKKTILKAVFPIKGGIGNNTLTWLKRVDACDKVAPVEEVEEEGFIENESEGL